MAPLMIDAKLLPLQRRLLRPMALGLVTFGVRADQVTITGVLVGIVALPLLASEQYIWALVFILLNRLLDGIDGAAELIAEFVIAMKYNLGLNKVLSTIHIYPTMAEANKYVAGDWKRNQVNPKLLLWLKRYHTWRRS